MSGPWLPPPLVADDVVSQRPLGQAFSAVVARCPDRIAVIDVRGSVRYDELDRNAEDVASRLESSRRGNGPVVILAGHDRGVIAAMLAVARVGAAYLVLDPNAPRAHLASVLAPHAPSAFVIDPRHRGVAIDLAQDLSVIDLAEGRMANDGAEWPDVRPDAALAVSSTSGTSGRPKAVVHSSRAVVRNAERVAAALGVTPDDTLVASLPLTFVAGATPVYTALLHGATVLMQDLSSGVASLVDAVRVHAATIVVVTGGLLTALAARAQADCPSVRWVLTGGDTLTWVQVGTLRRIFPRARVLHRYNTSEANWVAGVEIPPEVGPSAGPIPVGWPMPWLDAELVDGAGTVIRGVGDGELVIRGDDLSLGYLDDPTLTADRFTVVDGRRVHRTLDRVRREDDGLLRFVGRADATVKVHDTLVDPARVEAAICAQPGVVAAAVVAATGPDGMTVMRAFAVAPGLEAAALRGALAGVLPTAMIPSSLEIIDHLPLTAMGKVDARALADRTPATVPGSSGLELPRGGLESVIAARFSAVLGRAVVGPDDDLLALGADSLALEEIATGLATDLGRPIPVTMLLRHPTATALATVMRQSTKPATERDSHLIRVASVDGPGVPLVIFAGGGGVQLSGIARLARQVGDRTCYLVLPRGFEYRGHIDRTVPAIAASMVRDWQGNDLGPRVAVAGMSSGGILAVEAARQLRAAGVEVPLAVVLDTPPRSPRLISSRSLPEVIRRNIRFGVAERARAGRRTGLLRRGYWALRIIGDRTATRLRAAGARWTPLGSGRRALAFRCVVAVALGRYREQPFVGDLLLVRAAEADPTFLAGAPHDLRWGDHVDGLVDVVTVPGVHETLLDPPYVADTAAVISAALKRRSR